MESNTNHQTARAGYLESSIVFDIGSLYHWFTQLRDKRHPKGMRYSLATVLVLIMLAKLCGEDKPSGIAEWVQSRAKLLVKVLGLRYAKMPHHSTYRRILADCVEASEFEALMSKYLTSQEGAGRSVVIAIDGKTVRGTIDDASGRGEHLLAAYLPEEGIVLAQVAVDCKENEIKAAPRVLESLDLRRKIVIGDAMYTQRALSIQIVGNGGDYVWLVKENQARLRWDLEKLFEAEEPIPGLIGLPTDFRTAKTISKRHGRLEERSIMVSSLLRDYVDWPYMEQAFMLQRRFTHLKSGKIQQDVVYGITSLPKEKADPQRLLGIVRSLWGIENGLHYRRDVTLKEDATRLTKGKAGHNMATLNNLLLSILAQRGYRNIASARRRFNADPLAAFTLIALL